MKIHSQIIAKDNVPEYVILPYKEYSNLLSRLRDKDDVEDINDIRDFHARKQETFPFKMLQDIASGKMHPVRSYRKFRNMSQADLAKEAGISRQYLCQIEQRERAGSVKVLKKIAEILRVEIGMLVL